MMRILSGLVPLSIVLACSGVAVVVGGQERAIAADYIATATQKIGRQTTLPVLLPSEASFQQLLQSGDTTYVTVKSSSNRDYTVNFGNVPDCDANACLRFSISASWGKEIDDSKPKTRDSTYKFIQLSDGTKALATKECGASCWGRVQWKYKGALYQVWGKARDYDVIVAIANSAVSAGDRSNPSVQTADNRSSQANGQKGAVNLGGSSYFSWGLLKPESRDNNQSQIVMGYGCQTQNQLEGISQRASVSRYVIKRGRGSDDWWLESLGGVVVRPTPNGYVSEKVEGISSSELKRYVTDASSGFLKRDMDVDGLGNACINGGIQGALNYIQGSGSNKPIAQPPKPPSNGYSEKEFVQSWSNVNPALKPFLGTWLEPEGNIRIYPATVKDRVCLVVNTSGQVIVDIGTVTNGQITKLSEGGGPYISRRGKPGERSWTGEPENKELLVNVNPKGNLVAWRFLNRDTTSIKVQHPSQGLQGLPQEIVRGRSGEIQKFDKAECTAGLPQGSIAKPIEPLTPIAASNTYAYPSPQEFAQFKKTLKPSPVGLSAADRKLRQDFQAEWQKKNPAIGPYVGAWKTADNQDIYVFPSSQAGRACVVEKKDGEFKAAIGVSMTADMRYSLTHGQFRVAGMTDVVAGRSDKSQPLSALYAAIGSPDVSSSVRQDLEQAKCLTALPGGRR
jgi:hypothetical protein